jgi:Uma2 family endonuclease
MSPSPIDSHQKILIKLSSKIFNFVDRRQPGEVRVTPYDVHFDEQNVFQPDILFIAKENAHKIKNHLYGAPDLVIEILSPRTERYDKTDKKKVYESYGVKEYFIIERSDKSVMSYFLINDEFIEVPSETGAVDSRALGSTFTF